MLGSVSAPKSFSQRFQAASHAAWTLAAMQVCKAVSCLVQIRMVYLRVVLTGLGDSDMLALSLTF